MLPSCECRGGNRSKTDASSDSTTKPPLPPAPVCGSGGGSGHSGESSESGGENEREKEEHEAGGGLSGMESDEVRLFRFSQPTRFDFFSPRTKRKQIASRNANGQQRPDRDIACRHQRGRRTYTPTADSTQFSRRLLHVPCQAGNGGTSFSSLSTAGFLVLCRPFLLVI